VPAGNDYPSARANGERTSAHRAAWILWRGPIPDGMFALHHCDNPACINPDHIYLGTQMDNMRDRQVRERSGQKLTMTDVIALRLAYIDGATPTQLARRYDVSANAIWDVIKRRSWKHV